MRRELYLIKCLTNLHVGSGEANFNIVDKEVEKDPITGYPIIHASGIKGALRDAFSGSQAEEKRIFGVPGEEATVGTGAYRFLDARMICRPLRAAGGTPSIDVTTVSAINDFLQTAAAFGFDPELAPLEDISFGNEQFLCSKQGIRVEGESTGLLAGDTVKKLEPLLGSTFAIAKDLDDYDLPVIARNNLQTENGNLWYEEYVPRGSMFYLIALMPEGDSGDAVIPKLAQLGGNASIGCGWCSFEKKWSVEA